MRFRPSKTSEAKKSEPSPALAEAKGEKKSDRAARKKEKNKSERTVYIALDREQVPSGAKGGAPQALQVKTGITDGNYIEVIEGLKEGDRVIVGQAKEEGTRERAVNPFAFGRRK